MVSRELKLRVGAASRVRATLRGRVVRFSGRVVSGPIPKAGKLVHGWAWEGDADASSTTSNSAKMEWPRGSGRWVSYPEIDRCAWFPAAAAQEKMNPAQAEFVGRLEALLTGSSDARSSNLDV